jgi:toxin ParE1/3/4
VTAKRIYYSIKKQIMTLNSLSFRYPLVDDETVVARGLRIMPVENYFVFYVVDEPHVDEPHKEVHVLRVLYNRREWENLL